MILCVGMMVCDTLLSPVPIDIFQRDSADISVPCNCCGGDALGTAIGLARLGRDVSVIGRISDDINGNFILRECCRYGVDTTAAVFDREYSTACSYALIDEQGERHYLSDRRIFDRLCGSDVPDWAIEKAEIIYFGSAMAMRAMDSGGIADMFRRAHQHGKMTAMDAAVTQPDRVADWMEYLAPAFEETDIFFPSMEEAKVLTGETEPEKIMEYFRKFHMKIFGIKLGAKGCFATDFERSVYIACPEKIKVADTSGAGDSFMAGLLCGISCGWDAFTSAEFAVCAASKKVGVVGGTSGIPGFEEVYDFFKSRKR